MKNFLLVTSMSLTLLVLFSSISTAQDITSNLLAYWKLDETQGTVAADSSSNGNDGNLANGPIWVTGKTNNAVAFDGVNDYINTGVIDVTGSQLTLAAWFKADDLANCETNDCRIISKATGIDEQDHYYMLSTINSGSNTRVRFRLKANGTTTTLIASSGNLQNSTWYHVAAVYDGSTMKLYLDGNLVGSASKTGTLNSNPSVQTWIGENPPTVGSRPFDGIIDEVRIYDRALTQDDIIELYNYVPANQAPIVDAGADQVVLLADNAQLNGAASDDGLPVGGTVTTLWSEVSGPGTVTFDTASSLITTASFSAAGDYILELTADDTELTNSDTVHIEVKEANTPPVADDQSVVINEDSSIGVTLTASDIDDDALTYSIVEQPLNGIVTLDSNVATYTPNPNYHGLDSFTFVANDGLANSDEAAVSITINSVNDAPVASFTAVPKNGSAPLTVSFDASASTDDGSIVSYNWNFGDSTTGTGATTSHVYSTNSSYIVTLTVTDDGGSQDAHTESIVVTDVLPPAVFELTDISANEGRTAVGDVDGDGFNDIAVHTWASNRGTGGDGKLIWLKYPDWQEYTVKGSANFFGDGVVIADIDNDGHNDIVTSKGNDNLADVYWYENPGGSAQSGWIEHFVATIETSSEVKDIEVHDMDEDGKLDIVARSKHYMVVYYQNSPTNWAERRTSTAEREGMAVGDIDNDGDYDVVLNGFWLENPGARANNWSRYDIDSLWFTDNTGGWQDHSVSAATADFNNDGKTDVVFSHSEKTGFYVTWYESVDPYLGESGWNVNQIQIVDYAHSLQARDFNGDGHVDIMAATLPHGSNPNMFVFFNEGDGVSWDAEMAAVTTAYKASSGDIDNDGDFDIVTAVGWEHSPIRVVRNNGVPNPSLSQWQTHAIDGSLGVQALFVDAADVDGDGLVDLATGNSWWKNPGTLSDPWAKQAFGTPFNNLALFYDVDGDGDMDAIGVQGIGTSNNHDFVWAENDGSGSFTMRTNFGTVSSGDFLQGVVVDNFGSGPQLVVSWHNGAGGVYAFDIPSNPATQTWTYSLLSSTTQQEDLSSGDIDNDGDKDLLLGTQWLRNNGGSWTTFTLGTVSDLGPGEPDRNELVDINGDGRLDAVVALENDTEILWFEAPTDPTQSWTRHIIADVPGQGFSMDAADFDNDGDIDITVGEHRGIGNNHVLIFENQDSGATWVEHLVESHAVGTADHHDGTQAVDIDGDGDFDIMSIGWTNQKLWLFENTGATTPTGPTITQQPISQSAVEGQRVIFEVAAIGENLSYQWMFNGAGISGATDAVYTLSSVDSADSGSYSVRVTNNGSSVASVSAALDVFVAGSGGWFSGAWSYRFPVTVTASSATATDKPVDLVINFTDKLAGLSVSEAFDEESIRIVEVDETGAIINNRVDYQFDKDANYNPNTKASGTLVFIMEGATPALSERVFHFYFDVTSASLSPLYIPNLLEVSNITHEGFESFEITADNHRYIYHKDGGGFASLFDAEGNDWISFVNDSGSGADGWFRGIPNAVYPEDVFHPGRLNAVTTLVSSGPFKITLSSQSLDGLWDAMWEIYPSYATMTMLAIDHNYWFQYEGTPGGTTEGTDYITFSNGNVLTADNQFTQDIAFEEWVYIGDAASDRSLFVAHHDDDPYSDRWYQMDGPGGGAGMTIFAFGRSSGTNSHLPSVPESFSLGFLEDSAFSAASEQIRGSYFELSLFDGDAEQNGTPVPTPTTTPTSTSTPTRTPTPTQTRTPTPTGTQTPTPTRTPTPTPTITPTPISTGTRVPPNPTNTPIPTPTTTPTPLPSSEIIYLSLASTGNVGGLGFADEDIITFDTGTSSYSLYFDGSDVGITTDVNAFVLLADNSILMSFDTTTTVAGIGAVDDSDIVRFLPTSTGSATSGSFTLYFDGSDVGLTQNSENIDGLGLSADGRLVMSTIGLAAVNGLNGVRGEDLMVFTATTLGENTSGDFSLYFDGSDVNLTERSENLSGYWYEENNGDFYLSTTGAFSVSGLSGDPTDIFICSGNTPGSSSSCSFSLYFDGSANGLGSGMIDGFSISG